MKDLKKVLLMVALLASTILIFNACKHERTGLLKDKSADYDAFIKSVQTKAATGGLSSQEVMMLVAVQNGEWAIAGKGIKITDTKVKKDENGVLKTDRIPQGACPVLLENRFVLGEETAKIASETVTLYETCLKNDIITNASTGSTIQSKISAFNNKYFMKSVQIIDSYYFTNAHSDTGLDLTGASTEAAKLEKAKARFKLVFNAYNKATEAQWNAALKKIETAAAKEDLTSDKINKLIKDINERWILDEVKLTLMDNNSTAGNIAKGTKAEADAIKKRFLVAGR